MQRIKFDEEKTLELYQAGLSDRQIARTLGLPNHGPILRWRKRNGLASKYNAAPLREETSAPLEACAAGPFKTAADTPFSARMEYAGCCAELSWPDVRSVLTAYDRIGCLLAALKKREADNEHRGMHQSIG